MAFRNFASLQDFYAVENVAQRDELEKMRNTEILVQSFSVNLNSSNIVSV